MSLSVPWPQSIEGEVSVLTTSATNSKDARYVLSTTGWISGRPAAFREKLLDMGRLQRVAAGEVLNIAGSTGEGIWGVVSGQIALMSGINSADAPISLVANPGSWMGYAPLFGYPLQVNANAVIDSVVLRIPFADIRQLLAENPGWWEHFGHLAMERLQDVGMLAVDLLLTPPRRRVAAILLHQSGCRRIGTPASPIYLTQARLGEMASLSRHPVRRILCEFEAKGWIEHSYRCIHVRAAGDMRRLVDDG